MPFFIQIDNLLNHRHYAAAQFGSTPYGYAGNFIARPFAPWMEITPSAQRRCSLAARRQELGAGSDSGV